MPLATYRHGDWATNLPHEAANTTSTSSGVSGVYMTPLIGVVSDNPRDPLIRHDKAICRDYKFVYILFITSRGPLCSALVFMTQQKSNSVLHVDPYMIQLDDLHWLHHVLNCLARFGAFEFWQLVFSFLFLWVFASRILTNWLAGGVQPKSRKLSWRLAPSMWTQLLPTQRSIGIDRVTKREA